MEIANSMLTYKEIAYRKGFEDAKAQAKAIADAYTNTTPTEGPQAAIIAGVMSSTGELIASEIDKLEPKHDDE